MAFPQQQKIFIKSLKNSLGIQQVIATLNVPSNDILESNLQEIILDFKDYN